jgi:hypothetical protein
MHKSAIRYDRLLICSPISPNEAAQFYEGNLDEDIAFLRGGGKNLHPPELLYLRDLDAWCRRAIHLQCAAGRDTPSLWHQGTAEVVGLNISKKMIRAAQRKSDALNAPAVRQPESSDHPGSGVRFGRVREPS